MVVGAAVVDAVVVGAAVEGAAVVESSPLPSPLHQSWPEAAANCYRLQLKYKYHI